MTVIPQTFPLWLVYTDVAGPKADEWPDFGPHRVMAWSINDDGESVPFCRGVDASSVEWAKAVKWQVFESLCEAQWNADGIRRLIGHRWEDGDEPRPNDCGHDHREPIAWCAPSAFCNQLAALEERFVGRRLDASLIRDIAAAILSLPTRTDRVGITDSVTAVITKGSAS